MTLEEKLKVCSICKNRKHSIKEGLVCGKTGKKPAFADECPDFDIDIAEQERLKKNAAEVAEADHRMSGAFGAYIGFIASGAISFLMNFLAYSQFTLEDIFSIEFMFALFFVYFCAYAIYAYIEKKSDAIFIAKYLSIIMFLELLPDLFTGALTDIVVSLIPVGFFLFLTYSKEINKRMPKEERKLTKLNKIMVILSIIVQVFLYIGDFMGTELNAATVLDSDEKKLIELCKQTQKSLPIYMEAQDIYWTDITLGTNAVEYIYQYNNAPLKSSVEETELSLKYVTEDMKSKAFDIIVSNEDEIFTCVSNSSKYGLKFSYYAPDGKLVHNLLVPNSEIKRIISQGRYTTKQSDFLSFLESYNKFLPTDFMGGCLLCKCSLSKDGKTIHYDLKLYGGDTPESLAELTPERMKEHIMQTILPNILGDPSIDLAIRNQMNISFDHTSEDVSSWKVNILVEPSEYNQLLNQ